jgi:phosphatidylserine/phosphatidylglycerophosphate/cardiolipin synthase-like enzyme
MVFLKSCNASSFHNEVESLTPLPGSRAADGLRGSTGAWQRPSGANSRQIEVAFSSEAGAEALEPEVIDSARQSLRLAAYSFTSPGVVPPLINARRRDVEVKVLFDDKGHRGKAGIAAMEPDRCRDQCHR